MRKVVRIERVSPVENANDEPLLTPKGYKMADPGGSPDRPRPAHAIFQRTLEDVAGGLQRGLSLWMKTVDAGELLVPAQQASGGARLSSSSRAVQVLPRKSGSKSVYV